MSHKLYYWIAGFLILIFIVAAYNIPVEGASRPSQGRTVAILSLQGAVTPQGTETAQQSLIVLTASATPTNPPADTVTPTYSVPMLTVRDATNCRTGPGKTYEIIVLYPVNRTLEIVGRYEPGNFWLVKSPESPTGTCWLWGEYVDVLGSYGAVASVTPPPTPVASIAVPLQGVPLPTHKYYCNSMENTLSFEMTWESSSEGRVRYRVFRDGQQIAELPAGSPSYSETISMPASRSAEYYVEVYNRDGSEYTPVIRVSCL